MENTTEKQEFEFSLVSFLQIFKGKLKMLIAVGLISAILGGTVGALVFTVGKKTYGNTLAFYFPTPEVTGYSTVIPLLESDLFTENVLIGTKTVEFSDADGTKADIKLPDLPYTEDEEKTLTKHEFDKLSSTQKIKDLKNELKELPYELNLLKSTLDEATNEFTPIEKEYDRLWKVYADSLVEDAKDNLNAIQASYDEAKANLDKAQKAYDDCFATQKAKEKELFLAEKTLTEATEKSNEIINKLRAEWRRSPENKELVDDFHENVTYSFTKDGSPLEIKNTTVEDTSGKFLYINVRVHEDQALADKIITNILNEISEFVISNTTPVEKNDQIECIRISSGDAKDVNDTTLVKSILIYTLIFFAAVEVIACLLIICSFLKRTFFPKAEPTVDCIEEGKRESDETDANENNE